MTMWIEVGGTRHEASSTPSGEYGKYTLKEPIGMSYSCPTTPEMERTLRWLINALTPRSERREAAKRIARYQKR